MRLRLLVPSILSASCFLIASEARAQDAAPPATQPAAAPADPNAPATEPAAAAPAAPAATTEEKAKKGDEEEEEELKHVALTANPLSLILLRIGVNVEYLPVRHHAFILNPYFQSISAESGSGSATLKSEYTTIGTELGYRFYTGNRGANGFFVGPAFFIQNTNAKTTSSAGAASASADNSTTVYGAILDLGGQHVTKGGFVIGGGVGVMYLTASNDKPGETSSTVKFSGVLPRFLFTVGYSF